MRPLLIIGGGGLLLWYAYSKGLFGGTATVTPAGGGGTTTPPAGSGGTTTTPTGGTSVNPNSLSAIFNRMVADAHAPAAGLTPDGWGYSLNRVQTLFTAPDPGPLFSERTVNVSAQQYWAAVAPIISQQYGLSGIRGMGRVMPQRAIGWA